jgi:predicted permease
MSQSGLVASLVAALQASLSVLLVIFYGIIAARWKLLDNASSKSVSKICVKMFLPALLLTKIGAELHYESAHRYVVIVVGAIVCHFVSFLIGVTAHLTAGMPNWITAAIMFNNTTSYPLLLIMSLDETGILSGLITTDEPTSQAVERAKSYFLVFSTISSCLTFAIGPRLIDNEQAPDPPDKESIDGDDDEVENGDESGNPREPYDARLTSDENTSLLQRTTAGRRESIFLQPSRNPSVALEPRKHRRPLGFSIQRWMSLHPRIQWTLLFLYDFLNAPLIGAVLGATIGLIPALQRAFFNDTADGGIFSAWLTTSLKSVGQVFVPLPVVIAGVSLYNAHERSTQQGLSIPYPWTITIFTLVVRFLIWPVISIATIYGLAKHTNIVGTDPMLWFTLMLMPTGPPAMKLTALLQVSDASEEDESKVAKLLTVCCGQE